MKVLSCLTSLIVLCLAGSAHAGSFCRQEKIDRLDQLSSIRIDDVWSGVRAQPGAATVGSSLMIAYYNKDRYVSIASVDPRSGVVCFRSFGFRFEGWDAHNNLRMAVGEDGSVHVAGGSHGSPIFYAVSKTGRLDDFREGYMLGKGEDEQEATYPTFLKATDKSLLVMYRIGHSGEGVWVTNRWDNGKWFRMAPAYGDTNGHHSVSAYPSTIVTDSQGVSHVAIVWRETPDVATNYQVDYAQTRDFVHWSGYFAKGNAGPVMPGQADIVDKPGLKQGLVNSAQLVLGRNGEPVIFYTKYNEAGKNAVFAARPGEGEWVHKEIAADTVRSPVQGGGTMVGLVSMNVVASTGKDPVITITFPSGARTKLVVGPDLSTSKPPAMPNAAQLVKTTAEPRIEPPKGMPAAISMAIPVRQEGFDGPVMGRLIWYAQQPNRDHPRPCTSEAPLACNPPPSPMKWVFPESLVSGQ
ncbi:BNR-4 repeat-containing protein [Allorhizobium undicola]|uniref:BNR-4 repeat-containing protein n=1 Tax=Allorhizobium undicola TaxID=78527 RepID=UPI003D333D19